MKNKSSISMGPGASSLILIFVMLSLSVLAMLSLTGGYNDKQTGLRSAQVTQQVYELFEDAEHTRATVGEILEFCRDKATNQQEYENLVDARILSIPPLPMSIGQSGAENDLSIEDGWICWQDKDGVYTLDCAVLLDPYEQEEDHVAWVRHNLTVDRAQMEDEWEEWD